MLIILRKYRWLLEPIIAVVFYVLWILAETGRTVGAPWPAYPFTLAVLAAAIGLARAFPRVAIMLPSAVLVFQLAFPPARYGETTWPVYFGILIACFIVSATANKKTRLLALPVTVAYGVICSMLMGIPALSDGWGWSAWVGATYLVNPVQDSFLLILAANLVLAVGTWSLAFGLRSSRLLQETDAKFGATVEELHSAEIDLIVSRERDRIAQDVHDIMAHSLAVIIAQADGARFIGPQRPEAIGDSLERIAGSARSSLSEVRILIESLVSEPEGHSNPTIENLDELLERMRGAGLATSIERFGDSRALTPGQQLAVYRIVQEALTNALKHAGREPSARITMDWRGPGLALSISSTGTPVTQAEASDSDSRTTRGLYGMRERARLAGGWLTSGADDDGDVYLVTAFIPSTGDEELATGEHAETSPHTEEAAAL
jgi:signal transduction histidine kinase